MLAPALEFYNVVLALHIAAVVVTFGVTFAYPVIFAVAAKTPENLPFAYRAEKAVGQRIIAPGLVVIIFAGAYLASKIHVWGETWVIVPLIIALVIGAMGGMFFTPTERKLIEIADRDVAAAQGGPVMMSAEHDAVAKRLQAGGIVSAVLVLVAIFFMAAKPFA
ncbi:MAG TPA: hypothetical protein VGI54_04775 [Solirubrobacteraceae bacterium]